MPNPESKTENGLPPLDEMCLATSGNVGPGTTTPNGVLEILPAVPNSYPLDEPAINMLADLAAQANNIVVARNAVLTYFLLQHKLKGKWQLAENNRELVQTPEPAPQGPKE
jgi:hypothetical protein